MIVTMKEWESDALSQVLLSQIPPSFSSSPTFASVSRPFPTSSRSSQQKRLTVSQRIYWGPCVQKLKEPLIFHFAFWALFLQRHAQTPLNLMTVLAWYKLLRKLKSTPQHSGRHSGEHSTLCQIKNTEQAFRIMSENKHSFLSMYISTLSQIDRDIGGLRGQEHMFGS